MWTLELILFLFINFYGVWCLQLMNEKYGAPSDEAINRTYTIGVDMGIINPEKYPLEAFRRDDTTFRDLYNEYVLLNGSQPINYDEWIVINNFGLLPDTQESLLGRKINKRSTADNKRRFLQTVKKGDILITGRGIGGLVGHAAIMTTDNIVLEMRGGAGWEKGIPSNNRQIEKGAWFEEHKSDWTTVYRCPDGNAARAAAVWADHKYYNPTGGAKKTVHVTYKITTDVWATNPSYCSKLVIQAYYSGTGSRKVISADVSLRRVIVPTAIPTYFLSPYKLKNIGKF